QKIYETRLEHLRSDVDMTTFDAIEILRHAGSIRAENGKLLARIPPAERAQLQPALDYLRSHREEALQLLASPPPDAKLADLDPDVPGVPFAQWKADQLNELFRRHGLLGVAGGITAGTVEDGLAKQACGASDTKEKETANE